MGRPKRDYDDEFDWGVEVFGRLRMKDREELEGVLEEAEQVVQRATKALNENEIKQPPPGPVTVWVPCVNCMTKDHTYSSNLFCHVCKNKRRVAVEHRPMTDAELRAWDTSEGRLEAT